MEKLKIQAKFKTKEYQEGFKAGYYLGELDGGEHDCRMFEPTVERAWQHHIFIETGLVVDRQDQWGYKLR